MTEVDDLQHVGVFRPTTEPSLGWGVIGTGWIAEQFVTGTLRHTPQRIAAVGSRSAERSAAFAARHGVEHSHGSYSALIEDPAVDAVYIGVTADQHRPLALEVIAAGKPVLVEKPFALTASEASEIRASARAAGVLVMEAMWTRYLPQSDAIRDTRIDHRDRRCAAVRCRRHRGDAAGLSRLHRAGSAFDEHLSAHADHGRHLGYRSQDRDRFALLHADGVCPGRPFIWRTADPALAGPVGHRGP